MKWDLFGLRVPAFSAAARVALCAALYASFCLCGCESMPPPAPSVSEGPARTPENSSVCYGIYRMESGVNDVQFAQMNTDFSPCNMQASASSMVWVTKPVVAGERYKLITVSGRRITMYFRLDGPSAVDFTVPSEPGLHYMGAHGVYEDKYSKQPVEMELVSLDAVLKMYKGTAWEPVIQKRIEELKNAK